MSRSILVIDTPECCRHCKLYDYVPCICLATGRFQNNISEDFKPDWCPLRDFPEKKEYSNAIPVEKQWCFESIAGWNACIDEILKGENGNE